MPKPYQPPTGRLPTNRRSFEDVVRDLRYAVFSVIRNRPLGNNQFNAIPLGSGYFVSPEVFVTASHVLNDPRIPHQDGDHYHLACNEGDRIAVHIIPDVKMGNQLHVFPESDLGLLIARGIKGQPFVALDYNDWRVGKEIGVAGYPVPKLHAINNQLAYDGLLFRVAKGVITSTYRTNLQTEGGQQLPGVTLLEVNFLFVPGNSGGPVFDAETGRVSAFVHGYTTTKIRERIEQANPGLAQNLPPGVSASYIENLNALYSIAIRIETCRNHLEKFGATL
jgi:S1-C subfamily serine protease